jgi:polysaccharide biosynthesis/export protein
VVREETTTIMKAIRRVAAAALLLLSAAALAQNAEQPTAAASSPASDAAAKTTPAAGPDYIIGADDVLHVAVWKEPDLTATLPVRSDGKISLPLLNDVQAAGLTPMQLADSLTLRLKKYIADPRVTVVVTQINSKRIYFVGEVAHAGAMSMLPNMTALQAIASAGLTQFANTKKIYVMRLENGKQVKMPVNYHKLVKGEDLDHNYILQPGDTIVVP